jgi:hypothetical protein
VANQNSHCKTFRYSFTSRTTGYNTQTPQLGSVLAKSHNISVVYLATDAREPSTNPDLAILYATFPCTFTIDNFTDPANQPGWNALNNAANAHDGRNMKKYLIPMVDATIASRGRLFVGTESSTFSGYISRLHDVFWTHQQAASLIGYRN